MKPVCTIEDLPTLPAEVKLGVVGNPIAHSLSPPMQQAALDAAGLPFSYIRLLSGREDGEFETLIQALIRAGFAGVNVTVPFKKRAYALADAADALSTLCGAANTLVFQGGRVSCYNTDGPGFERAVQELCGRRPAELSIVLLGACGGAGVAVAAQCVLSGCRQLTLVNRPRPELESLAELLRPRSAGRVDTSYFSAAELPDVVAQADLIVNATSLGLAEGDALPLPPELLREGQVVYDLITHPTALQRAAAERGCLVSGGQSMLLWQGAYAFERWFGSMPDAAAMHRALTAASAAPRAH